MRKRRGKRGGARKVMRLNSSAASERSVCNQNMWKLIKEEKEVNDNEEKYEDAKYSWWTEMRQWLLSYFLHFVPVTLCPVLDGLLLLLRGTQLLLQPLQLLQQRGHLVGFVLGILLHPAQPVQLAAHSLALHCVGTLQAD